MSRLSHLPPSKDVKEEVTEVEELEEVESEEILEPEVGTEIEESVYVRDMVERVRRHMEEFSTDIEEEFNKELEKQLKVKERKDESFLFENELWDLWVQKLFAQFISVKIWIIGLITVLLVAELITNVQFASILGVIMGMKGIFNTAAVWKDKTSDRVIDRV